MKLSEVLNSKAKAQFFDRLSQEAYSNLPADVLTMFEGEKESRRPYIIFDTLQVSPEFCEAIRNAGEEFWSLAVSTSKIFQYLQEDEILDWGFLEDYVPQFLAVETPPSEMRLDIAVNPQAFKNNVFKLEDFKVLEANSSTPGFWAESFVFNELIANHLKGWGSCPNQELWKIQTADFISYLQKQFPEYQHGKDTVYFSFPYVGNHEDILSFDARMGYFGELGGKYKFLYVEQLVIETDIAKDVAITTPEGEEVKYLFLHYPNEWLVEDRGELADPEYSTIPAARPWDYIQQLILEKKLAKVPPISSDIIQNKAFFAFLWEGVHSHRFDLETERLIQTLVPQTYCTYDEAVEYGLSQIWEKPIYGREGAGIILWDNQKNELLNSYSPDFDDEDWYSKMLAVFQENCEMPRYHYEDEELILMFTVYLSSEGRATGIGCRAVPASKGVIDTQAGLWFPINIQAK